MGVVFLDNDLLFGHVKNPLQKIQTTEDITALKLWGKMTVSINRLRMKIFAKF